MTKISFEELNEMFSRKNVSIQMVIPSTHVGSKKGFTPSVTSYKPPKGISPKQWEDQRRELKKRNAKSTKKLYKCPVCEQPIGKLDYCVADKKWPVLKDNK